MSKWIVEYEPVKPPTQDKRGWKFPYQGDDWPTVDDWYWVWGMTYPMAPDRYLRPFRAWWDGKRGSFPSWAKDTIAWHKAVVIGGRP